jgi:NAD(P)-dependent dehydrogenase (short-subunit alcohol dehydrogenase family)
MTRYRFFRGSEARRRPEVSALAGAALAIAAVAAVRRWRESRYSLAGRVVLITGGSRGLGLLLAREYARLGARLVLAARDKKTLDRACAELVSGGVEVLGIPCDVGDRGDVAALIETVIERCGRIDVIVNDAGRIEVGPLGSMTPTDFEHAMDTNFWGAFNVVNASLPHLVPGQARIVNISSVGGLVSVPHLLPYSASKFALTGFSLGLAAELAPRGIRVTTVCPWLMRTGSPVNATFKGDAAKEHAWFSVADSLPLLSLSAPRAARAIVRASRRGDRMLKLGLATKLASLVNALWPGTVAAASGIIERLLPDGTDKRARRGGDVETRTPKWLTRLSDRAAEANNELG